MAYKRPLGKSVYQAAIERIEYIFDHFDAVCVSFSGGKDSTVMLHMVADIARRRGRKFGLLFIDLEAQYRFTIEHIQTCYDLYADIAEPYWVCLPLSLRNAVSQFQPKWTCWDQDDRERWVRTPPDMAITDPKYFPFFTKGMEFEDFVPEFTKWYSNKNFKGAGVGRLTASLVGIRSDESLNRYRTIASQRKSRFDNIPWTTWNGNACYSAFPIYDWKTQDIWVYHGKHRDKPYNLLYDRMYQAGLSIHQSRICQPYGDDQRKGLWLYQIIEPETWGKVVARVNGANAGALYARDSGNINGTIKVHKPDGHTWESFCMLLLDSMPPKTAEHYRNKIAVFLHWWQVQGFQNGIPDEADPELENSRKIPSWRRIAKSLLRNDYWCKGLSFSQHRSDAYERYVKYIKEKRKQWNII